MASKDAEEPANEVDDTEEEVAGATAESYCVDRPMSRPTNLAQSYTASLGKVTSSDYYRTVLVSPQQQPPNSMQRNLGQQARTPDRSPYHECSGNCTHMLTTASNNNSNNVKLEDIENNPQSDVVLRQQNNSLPNTFNQHCNVLPQGETLPQNSSHGNVPYNWQACKSTVKERLSFIHKSDSMSDVHFIVGKGSGQQRIPAHKFVLSISSAVFDAMFNGGMATYEDDIELPDIDPAAFRTLLQFVYSDELTIEPETVMTTLYAAKKYAIPALERACVEFLKTNLNSENAFMLLTQARLFDEAQLAHLCLERIDKNTSEALAAEGFMDIDLETLSVVLERDTLGIRECKLFSSVCNWAQAECERQGCPSTPDNRRTVLAGALHLIRFPLMSVEEFAVGAAQSGILTDREVVQLFLYFTVNPKPSVPFSDVPRCCLTGKEQVISRFCQTEHRWGYSGTSDRIRFMVNKRIFLVGFGLYGSIHGPTEYGCSIQIIHTDTGKICGNNDLVFQCDGTNSTFRVMFKEPVEVLPNSNYTACATLKGPDSFYGTKGLRKVTHESVSDGKVTFQFTYAAGNNNGTSVEDGQIPELLFYSCHGDTKSLTTKSRTVDKKSARVLPSSNVA